MSFPPLFTTLLGLAAGGLCLAQSPEEVFAIHCAACHATDYSLVGPSLVEISAIYREDAAGFLAWTLNPGRKRPESVEMPAMAHLGEETITPLHAYILKASAGKSERPAPTDGPPIATDVRRPQVQRIFLPDASPAAIAVALPGDLAFCFDAASSRLRYIWKGGFIDGQAHWKGNGSSLAKIDGGIIYRETAFPLTVIGGTASEPEFKGYRMEQGLPVFLHRRDGVEFSETIRPLADGSGVERHFTTSGSHALEVSGISGAVLETSTGGLEISADQAKSFILTLRWK